MVPRVPKNFLFCRSAWLSRLNKARPPVKRKDRTVHPSVLTRICVYLSSRGVRRQNVVIHGCVKAQDVRANTWESDTAVGLPGTRQK